jgi:peptidoglycan/LPS O-acetylase OafA/YrhL
MPLSEYEQRILNEIELDLGEHAQARRRRRRRVLVLVAVTALIAAAAATIWVTTARIMPTAAGVPVTFILGMCIGAMAALGWIRLRSGRVRRSRRRGPFPPIDDVDGGRR